MNASQTHAAIKAGFLANGGTLEQWERVASDPRKFNVVWCKLLGLPGSTKPPPADMRNKTNFRKRSIAQ